MKAQRERKAKPRKKKAARRKRPPPPSIAFLEALAEASAEIVKRLRR